MPNFRLFAHGDDLNFFKTFPQLVSSWCHDVWYTRSIIDRNAFDTFETAFSITPEKLWFVASLPILGIIFLAHCVSQFSAAPRPENPDSDEKGALFGLDIQRRYYRTACGKVSHYLSEMSGKSKIFRTVVCPSLLALNIQNGFRSQ
jgi:hypothetical protein